MCPDDPESNLKDCILSGESSELVTAVQLRLTPDRLDPEYMYCSELQLHRPAQSTCNPCQDQAPMLLSPTRAMCGLSNKQTRKAGTTFASDYVLCRHVVAKRDEDR